MKSILEGRPGLAREINKVLKWPDICGKKDGLNATVEISRSM